MEGKGLFIILWLVDVQIEAWVVNLTACDSRRERAQEFFEGGGAGVFELRKEPCRQYDWMAQVAEPTRLADFGWLSGAEFQERTQSFQPQMGLVTESYDPMRQPRLPAVPLCCANN